VWVRLIALILVRRNNNPDYGLPSAYRKDKIGADVGDNSLAAGVRVDRAGEVLVDFDDYSDAGDGDNLADLSVVA